MNTDPEDAEGRVVLEAESAAATGLSRTLRHEMHTGAVALSQSNNTGSHSAFGDQVLARSNSQANPSAYAAPSVPPIHFGDPS